MGTYSSYSGLGGSGGVAKYANFASLPAVASNGDLAVTLDTDTLYIFNGVAWVPVTGGGTGTVSSVALADGSTTPIYNITGSPIVGAGTLVFTFKNQTANTFLAGPSSGGPAQPTFRTLTPADVNVAATFGTRAAPLNITAVGGITFASLAQLITIFIQGSGGPVVITANPAIVNSSTAFVGQRVLLIGRNDVNTVQINNNLGTDQNGSYVLDTNAAIEYEYDGVNWFEISRRS